MDRIFFEWILHGKRYREQFIPYTYSELVSRFGFNIKLEKLNNSLENSNQFTHLIEFHPTVSDLILDMSSIYSIKSFIDYKSNNLYSEFGSEKINEILNFNLYVQIQIDKIKIDISILINGEMNTRDELFETNLIQYLELVNKYIRNFKYLNRREKQEIIEQIEIYNMRALNEEFYKIYIEVNDWLNLLLDSENLSNVQISKLLRTITNQLKKIPSCFGGSYLHRYLRINMIMRHADLFKRFDTIERLKMALSQQHFESTKENLTSAAKSKMEDLQSWTLTYEEFLDDTFNGENKLIKLKNFFKSTKNILDETDNEPICARLINKYNSECGCFGILEMENTSFFALSSSQDYSGASKSFLKMDSEIESLANKLNNDLFGGGYVWATLTDKTLRYINYDFDRRKKNLAYLKDPVDLGSDTEMYNVDVVGFHYGCCERKMQDACSDWFSDKIYYSRWSPCEKCISSFKNERGSYKVYALSKDFSRWLKNGSKLEEYRMDSTFVPVI